MLSPTCMQREVPVFSYLPHQLHKIPIKGKKSLPQKTHSFPAGLMCSFGSQLWEKINSNSIQFVSQTDIYSAEKYCAVFYNKTCMMEPHCGVITLTLYYS
jgi:hypothetical protein